MGETSRIVLICVGAVCALVVGGGGTLWVVKAVVTRMLEQNKELVKSSLDTIKAQTKATDANTEATRALAATLNQSIAVQNERDKSLFRQLDRIERQRGRRHDDGMEPT